MKQQLLIIKNFLVTLPRKPFLAIIFLYQKTVSPDHGPLRSLFPYGYCRFYPTCSQYGYEVIQKRGILIGFFLTTWRILRCNPWNKGGVDLP